MTRVTVVILTLARPDLLSHTLDGLCSQTFKDFDVLLILKKSDSESIALSQRFSRFLNLRVKIQESDSLIGAYNEAIQSVSAEIIAFLDDDAIPISTWLSDHVSSYNLANVSGVSGDVVPAQIKNNSLDTTGPSEVAQFYDVPKLQKDIGEKFWNRPLKDQENFLAYISRAGYSQKATGAINGKKLKSLLCMAANMSIRKTALKDFVIPTSFIKKGIAFEQVIGWHLLKNGHLTVFNPRAKVYHLLHGRTMSRFLDENSLMKAYAEDELLFYYLFSKERGLSIMHRIVSFSFRIMVNIGKPRLYWKRKMYILKGIFFGNLLGIAWLISRNIHGSFKPIQNSFFKR